MSECDKLRIIGPRRETDDEVIRKSKRAMLEAMLKHADETMNFSLYRKIKTELDGKGDES